jgi:hypothetical protein
VDARASGDARGWQGGSKARELTNGTRTNDALADGEVVWSWHPLLVLNRRRGVIPTGIGQTFNLPMTVAT